MTEKIRPHHLERKAILYVRQSSAHQVLHNRESSALQYAMRDRLTCGLPIQGPATRGNIRLFCHRISGKFHCEPRKIRLDGELFRRASLYLIWVQSSVALIR